MGPPAIKHATFYALLGTVELKKMINKKNLNLTGQ